MNQLRTSDLFRYKQNYQQHKQKVKSIMNRSTESIHQLSQKQKSLIIKNNLSHEKALKFKINQKQRQISLINNKFVNRIFQNERRRTKLFQKEINSSRSEGWKAKTQLNKSSASSSRVSLLQKDNVQMAKKVNEVKSTISLRQFSKQYSKHNERSSMLSKFKIDARSFKFIAKNQILLEKINKTNHKILNVSKSKLSEKIGSSIFLTQKPFLNHKKTSINSTRSQSKLKKPLLNDSPKKGDVKLEKLKLVFAKNEEKKLSLMRITNPQYSVGSKIKLNKS